MTLIDYIGKVEGCSGFPKLMDWRKKVVTISGYTLSMLAKYGKIGT